MRRLQAISVILALVFAARAQDTRSHDKPTEQVVRRYLELVADGALLTSQGWKKTAVLFTGSTKFPSNGTIFLMTTDGTIGEMWMRGDEAEVQTKWTDDMGSIDSALRYHRPADPEVTMTSYVFRLRLMNEEAETTSRQGPGTRQWKIEEPLSTRWSTVEKAIAYVSKRRDETNDSEVKQHAEKTIAILNSLNVGCGSASAC